MSCTVCKTNEASGSAIINGRYIKDICSPCLSRLTNPAISSASADYDRRQDAAENGWMGAQPYTKDGQPSREFISLYPSQARKLFSEDDLRKYG